MSRLRQYYDKFLVEYYNGDRSASVHAGSMYYRVYFYINGELVGDRMFFEQPRELAEKYAKEWILEKFNEDQINQLHKAIS